MVKGIRQVLEKSPNLGFYDTSGTGVVGVSDVNWSSMAESAQKALGDKYWNAEIGMFNNSYPVKAESAAQFHYWWQAHGVDALVDGLVRTKGDIYGQRLREIRRGLVSRNGGSLPNLFYDDMEWMALAFLRAYDATGEEAHRSAALTLWDDILTGWNGNMDGGIAWKKDQLDYKNTPANGPAAILGCRIYSRFGKEEDLSWAERIYGWLKSHLVDPDSGFVWDGVNRLGDGKIDKDWEFTYCQGVFVGAGVELFKATGDGQYLADARRTAETAVVRLLEPGTQVLKKEGQGDGGLFKGILVRYLAELAAADPTHPSSVALADFLALNGRTLWEKGRDEESCLFGGNWTRKPIGPVDLSVQLSGIMLIEAIERLRSGGFSL